MFMWVNWWTGHRAQVHLNMGFQSKMVLLTHAVSKIIHKEDKQPWEQCRVCESEQNLDKVFALCSETFVIVKLLILQPHASSAPSRTSPVVHVKEEPLSPTHSSETEELCPVEVEVGAGSTLPADTPLSPTTFINSILQESEQSPAPPLPTSPQRCLSVACFEKWV